MSFQQTFRSKLFQRLVTLAEAAVFIAMALILSYIELYRMPQGGSVTPASMLPIILIGIRRGKAAGIGAAIVYSGLQMLQSFYAPPAGTAWAFALMILLDYVLAFGVLGLSGFFPKSGKGLMAAIPVCVALRFLCHFVSGIVLWGSYAKEGQAAWLYSLLYNGPVMAVEAAIMMVVAAALIKSKVVFYGISRE